MDPANDCGPLFSVGMGTKLSAPQALQRALFPAHPKGAFTLLWHSPHSNRIKPSSLILWPYLISLRWSRVRHLTTFRTCCSMRTIASQFPAHAPHEILTAARNGGQKQDQSDQDQYNQTTDVQRLFGSCLPQEPALDRMSAVRTAFGLRAGLSPTLRADKAYSPRCPRH